MNTRAPDDKSLLDALCEAAVDAIVISDAKGIIRRVNSSAARLFGYSAAQMIGQNVSMLMPAGTANHHDDFMSHHLATGESKIIGIGRSVQGMRRDGTAFQLHLSVGRGDVAGEPVFIAILHDLTQRIATEEALARSQRLDAIGQMTGGIAHDFNNLLTVIIGNLELLGMQMSDPAALAMIDDALDAAELGTDLTSRLTQFARKGNLNPESQNLNDGCQTSLSILRRTLGSQVVIETHLDPTIPQIVADPTQLRTAILNLALNSRDAMPHGGRLILTTETVEIDDTYIAQETDVTCGTYVRLSVTDTGQGMSPEARRRAFEPFYTTKPPGKGTGLGLAMVHGFMRQSGGHVTVYSEPGHGTTFALYFPVGTTHPLPAKPRAKPIRSGPPTGGVVMVVEDDHKVRRLTVTRIRALGYKTVVAQTGDAALAMLRGGTAVDLVFTDLVMPGTLTGYDLATTIRREYPGIAVALTSGFSENTFGEHSPSPARFAMLRKPYRQADLANLLRDTLGEV